MNAHWNRFVAVYNDLDGYPTLRSVAAALGLSVKTVKNRSCLIRAAARKGTSPHILISRQAAKPAEKKADPVKHAKVRAITLAGDIASLVTSSRYPLVNPEAIVVESHLVRRYDRDLGGYVMTESVPRTWLSDTLKVEPIRIYKGKRFIFTGAQNDAPVHEGFWRNLKAYAKKIGAEIVVGPWTYETRWWSENNPSARAYDSVLEPYLCFGQMRIGSNFVFCGEMNTLPTANRPISDLLTYSRGRWAVFPHAKRELKSVPSTDPNVQAHQVMTSGACTRPKVIPRKAGVKSIFHHVIGAVVVEFDKDGDLFCRHISADEDGSFYDLDRRVSDGRVTGGHRVKAITFADIHRAKLGPKVASATFGFDVRNGARTNSSNVLDTLKPEEVFLHDLFDNQARNHHHLGDNAYAYEQAVRKKESILDEAHDAAAFLHLVHRPWSTVRVVESNHDLALERYVREGRYRNDGANIRIGLQLEDAYLGWREDVARALDAYTAPPKFSLLEHTLRTIRPKGLEHVGWIYDGQSHLVDGIECGHHGFRGANGSKGTVSGFARMGRKMSIADKHSPEIMDGVYVAGTCELQHGYNKGPSGWAVSHIVQYADGKRTLVTLQNGKWRA